MKKNKDEMNVYKNKHSFFKYMIEETKNHIETRQKKSGPVMGRTDPDQAKRGNEVSILFYFKELYQKHRNFKPFHCCLINSNATNITQTPISLILNKR